MQSPHTPRQFEITKALTVFLIALLTTTASAHEAPDPFTTLAQTVGSWSGTLEYRDYRSDKLVSIPLDAVVETHGKILLRRLTYTDPGYKVRQLSVVTWDGEAGLLKESFVESGAIETSATAPEFVYDGKAWTMTVTQQGQDDNRPAMLRETTRYSGDRIVTVKEVDFQDGDQDEQVDKKVARWEFRNRVTLERVIKKSRD